MVLLIICDIINTEIENVGKKRKEKKKKEKKKKEKKKKIRVRTKEKKGNTCTNYAT